VVPLYVLDVARVGPHVDRFLGCTTHPHPGTVIAPITVVTLQLIIGLHTRSLTRLPFPIYLTLRVTFTRSHGIPRYRMFAGPPHGMIPQLIYYRVQAHSYSFGFTTLHLFTVDILPVAGSYASVFSVLVDYAGF